MKTKSRNAAHRNALMHLGNDPAYKEVLDLLVELLQTTNSEFLRGMFQATGYKLGLFKARPDSRWTRSRFGRTEVSVLMGPVDINEPVVEKLRTAVKKIRQAEEIEPPMWNKSGR